jgi:hypothetical protein
MARLAVRIKTWIADALLGLFGLLVILALMEGAARLVHGGARPMIASIRDAHGNPRLPPDVDFDVRIQGGPSSRLTTDSDSARILEPDVRGQSHEGGVLIVGDSQVMGWDMPFERAFGTLVGLHAGVSPDRVWLLAAAGQDPEAQLEWVREYSARHPQRHRLAVVAVNLGNDFEEMYFGRASVQALPTSAVLRQLTAHSVLFLDIALMKHLFGSRPANEVPLGVNLSMSSLDQTARHLLVGATADAVTRLVRALPPADQVLVVSIPQDSQIDEREFLKYRKYYSSDVDFATFRHVQKAALTRLASAEAELAAVMDQRGIAYMALDVALRTRYSESGYVDRSSHHLLASAHVVMAAAIAAKLGLSVPKP